MKKQIATERASQRRAGRPRQDRGRARRRQDRSPKRPRRSASRPAPSPPSTPRAAIRTAPRSTCPRRPLLARRVRLRRRRRRRRAQHPRPRLSLVRRRPRSIPRTTARSTKSRTRSRSNGAPTRSPRRSRPRRTTSSSSSTRARRSPTWPRACRSEVKSATDIHRRGGGGLAESVAAPCSPSPPTRRARRETPDGRFVFKITTTMTPPFDPDSRRQDARRTARRGPAVERRRRNTSTALSSNSA